jgi:hypothetical protein
MLLDQVPDGDGDELHYQERLRRQQEFLTLLKMRANKTEFPTRLHVWLTDWGQGRTPEYQRWDDEAYEKNIQFYIAVEKVLTADQRQRALQRLQQYADDCRSLSQSARNELEPATNSAVQAQFVEEQALAMLE